MRERGSQQTPAKRPWGPTRQRIALIRQKKNKRQGHSTNPQQQLQQIAVLKHTSEQHNTPCLSRPSHLNTVICFFPPRPGRIQPKSAIRIGSPTNAESLGHPSLSFLGTQEAKGMWFPIWKPRVGCVEDALVHKSLSWVTGCLM